MMGSMSRRQDEFAEFDLTESQIDEMIAAGDPVIVTSTSAPSIATVNRVTSTFGGHSEVVVAGSARARVLSQPAYAAAS